MKQNLFRGTVEKLQHKNKKMSREFEIKVSTLQCIDTIPIKKKISILSMSWLDLPTVFLSGSLTFSLEQSEELTD